MNGVDGSSSWLAQGTAIFTNYVLLPLRYADYTSPVKTFLLAIVIAFVGLAFWKVSNGVKNQFGRGILRILSVIAGINVITIGLISLKVWGGL